MTTPPGQYISLTGGLQPLVTPAVPTDGGARFYGGPDDGGVFVLVVEDAGEGTLVLANGTEMQRLQSGHSFWFAWYANFPDTAWWRGLAQSIAAIFDRMLAARDG